MKIVFPAAQRQKLVDCGTLVLLGHSPTQHGNNPFSSWPKLLFQSEAWCTTIHMKKSLICM